MVLALKKKTLSSQTKSTSHLIVFILSFFIVALGQPSRLSFLCPIASVMGYALFWLSVKNFSSKKKLVLSFVWFFFIQLCWHSWLYSTKYQGDVIVIVYILLCAFFSLQFTLCSFFVFKKGSSIKKAIFTSSLWTLFEKCRIFILSGYLWSPAGLALVSNDFSIQLASIGGIYFLSFWVMLTNVLVYGFFTSSNKIIIPSLVILFPYLFGAFHQKFLDEKGRNFSAVLVQTGLYPEEKNTLSEFPGKFIRPETQWKRILQTIKEHERKPDLIVLPEAAVPFGAFYSFLPLQTFCSIWEEVFQKSFEHFSILKSPYAILEDDGWKVSNGFINQALSLEYNCEVICGLDYKSFEGTFNSAVFFDPSFNIARYDKQILVPIGEYIPLNVLKPIAAQYGIFSSFNPGVCSKVFSNNIPKSASICVEEIYPMIIREARNNGACLMVNLTNDGWFPESNLPRQHWDHGRVRAVENGVYVLRACNTGITGVIDPFGNIVDVFKKNHSIEDKSFGSLFVNFPFHHHTTLYMIWGDCFVLAICVLGLYACIKNQITLPFFKV